MDFRKRIIEYVSESEYSPMKAYELFEAICADDGSDIKKDEKEGVYEEFSDSLSELIDEALVVLTKKNRIIVSERSSYIKGTYRSTTRGFGFVIPDEEYRERVAGDIFIPPDYSLGAINGDSVMVLVSKSAAKPSDSKAKDKNGRRSSKSRFESKPQSQSSRQNAEGKIVKILKHTITHITGTLTKQDGYRKRGMLRYFVTPDDPKLTFTVIVKPDQLSGAIVGDKVEVEVEEYPVSERGDASGRITQVFGESISREANYQSILSANEVKTEFDPETIKCAEEVSKECPSEDGIGQRLDLRDKIIFTIDGADAKDLDDAISIEREGSGYILGVHIADVSHYVRADSPLDREAFERGTSIYFTDKVVPMLPVQLSNGVCSLNGGVDRYTLSAIMHLDENGGIVSCTLHESVINSKVRGVYSEINDVIEKNRDSEFYDKYSVLFPDTLPVMVELYKKLDKNSKTRGALELETAEAKILIGEDGFPCDIVKRERGEGEKLIEQFMLCANEAVASWLFWQNMPCVYRIHEEPSPEKVQMFRIFAHNAGLDIAPLNSKAIHPTAYQSVLRQANERGLGTIVSYVMLRSLAKAKYSSVCSPHFGLAIDRYCHFTSPIRRYPDLSVHRIVKEVLKGKISEGRQIILEAFAESSAQASSENELKAIKAERDIEDLYKILFMQSHVGEEFDGIISSVTSFGFFVELENTCEGLVHISSLRGHFEYNESSMRLSCGLKSYNLGDKVHVQLIKADITSRKLDMLLITGDEPEARELPETNTNGIRQAIGSYRKHQGGVTSKTTASSAEAKAPAGTKAPTSTKTFTGAKASGNSKRRIKPSSPRGKTAFPRKKTSKSGFTPKNKKSGS